MHLCIDMQRIFAEPTPWHTPWMDRVLPVIEELARSMRTAPSSRALFRPGGPTICREHGSVTTRAGT